MERNFRILDGVLRSLVINKQANFFFNRMVTRMLNRIVLIGRLTRDRKCCYTSNGTAVTSFTLAVQRNYTNQQGARG